MSTKDQSKETRNDATTSTTRSSTSEPARQSGDRERSIERAQDRQSSGDGQRSTLTRPFAGTLQDRSTPFALMRRMTEDMERFLDHFGFGRFGTGLVPRSSALDDDLWTLGATSNGAWLPQVEMFNKDDKLIIRADLPGLGKDDVNVEVNQGVLTISGERKDEREEDRDGYYRSERSYGQFYRTIQLPEGIKEEQCEASFKDGVLQLEFEAPRSNRGKVRKIPIR